MNAPFNAYLTAAEAKNRAEAALLPFQWQTPDMTVLRIGRLPPPLPLEVFGQAWGKWLPDAAEAAAAPVDYVAFPLIATVSALIGHARWAQASPGWVEPPHLWCGVVGDSGSSKSPAADCILGQILPEIEKRMNGNFPDVHRDWKARLEFQQAQIEAWEKEVRAAQKSGTPPPLPPEDAAGPEPQSPRLRQNDVTIEKVATLLASAAPKGLLVVRDELAGWLHGMNAYNDSGRAFWIEAYGGRPYRVERVKHPEPIIIPRLAVAVTGGTQPDKLAELFKQADDGLLARFCWCWPDPLPFRIGRQAPGVGEAVEALDRLRRLDLVPGSEGEPHRPLLVPLAPEGVKLLEAFGQQMQKRQVEAGGLMRSAFGKARGLALRLSLVLEFLWWCGEPGDESQPDEITVPAITAACSLVERYLIPMAERVYGDAAATTAEKNAATLAKWIRKTQPAEVHVRHLQRNERLPGLNRAEAIHAACDVLVEAAWLRPPTKGGYQERAKQAYEINPQLLAPRSVSQGAGP